MDGMVEEVRVFEDFIREGPCEHMVGSHLSYFDGGVAVVGYFIILGARISPCCFFRLQCAVGLLNRAT